MNENGYETSNREVLKGLEVDINVIQKSLMEVSINMAEIRTQLKFAESTESRLRAVENSLTQLSAGMPKTSPWHVKIAAILALVLIFINLPGAVRNFEAISQNQPIVTVVPGK